MVDRAARRQLALLLRRYASGRIDEQQLIEGLSWQQHGDPAIEEMRHQVEGLPHCYDHSVSRRDVARWVVFLRSGEEYLWPPSGGGYSIGNWVLLILGVLGFSAAFLLPMGLRLSPWLLWPVGCASSCVWVVGFLFFVERFITPILEQERARVHGGDLALWPFHDAEQFARVVCRDPAKPRSRPGGRLVAGA